MVSLFTTAWYLMDTMFFIECRKQHVLGGGVTQHSVVFVRGDLPQGGALGLLQTVSSIQVAQGIPGASRRLVREGQWWVGGEGGGRTGRCVPCKLRQGAGAPVFGLLGKPLT